MKKIKNNTVRFGIRPKLFILVLVGFSLLIGITMWRIGVEAGAVASTSVNNSLEQSSVILNTKMQSRFDSIQETALSLAKDGRVLPLVYDGESATLQDLSLEFKQALAFDILFALDSDGVVLARSDRLDAIGHSVAGSALFNQALHGSIVHGIIVSQGKLLQIVAVPIFDNIAKDIVRGVIALAYELSPQMAQEINKLTESDVSFFIFDRDAEGKVVGIQNTYTTKPELSDSLNHFFQAHKDSWKSLYESRGEKTQLLINLNDDEYHAVVHPLATSDGKNLGFVLALRSQTELLKPFLKIQQQVFIVGMVCLFIACLLAWFIAHNISRPIISLISVTEKIENGNYPASEDYQRSNDEVGVLYDALFRMGKSIKDKADLESYLAQLADDIGDSFEFDDEDLLVDNTEKLDKSTIDLDGDTITAANEHIKAPSSASSSITAPISPDENTVLMSTQISAGSGRRIIAGDQLHAGDIIDNRYQVIKRLGVGAMGQVYMVKDIDLNETVALKMLNQQNFSADIIQFFKDEIRLARRITHRNVLRTFDFGTWEGFYYITMEYVHGFDLAHLIDKKGALESNIGVVMARQICSAINAAHEQGIIHRDLKPSNMMITKQGILKIMDFGLAMQVQSSKKIRPDGSMSSSNATMIAGTPRFMAPEQFVAGELDERTDIYAVGVILFTLFTGESPFQAKGFDEWLDMHTYQEPPLLRSILPSASESLEKIINKAMSKKKEDRYASIKELLDDLQAI